MNDEFEIIVTPHKRWKRLALLLESETKDNCLKKSTQYHTFYYEDNMFYDVNSIDCTSSFDEDMEQFKQEILWVKNRVISTWKHFIDTI